MTMSDPVVVSRHSEVIREVFRQASEFEKSRVHIKDVGILASEVNVLGDKVSRVNWYSKS